MKDQKKALPKNFNQFNRIDKINLTNKEEIDSLVFKMAAWDVINNTKAYRSNYCSHDLYYSGYDWKDIPEGD
jgi:hypothetical protein